MTIALEPFQFPSGQLGHLDAQQKSAFLDLKKILSENNSRVSGDDGFLLRFLRARKFDAPAAAEQITATETWRKENKIDELYDVIDIDQYEAARGLYTMWTGRRDKRGFPFYVFDIGAVSSSKVAAYEHSEPLTGFDNTGNTPTKMLKLFALFEHFTEFVNPWCTASPSRPFQDTAPITQGCYIVDVGQLGLRQALSLKSHLQDSSSLATQHYPETLGTIFIIGAPSWFPTIWSWIKRWLDPIVVAKIHILTPKQILPTLSDQIGIENVPVKYGGKLEWQFGDLPMIDPALLKLVDPCDGTSQSDLEVPIGPIRWIKREDGRMAMVALGSRNGVLRRRELGVIREGYELTRSDEA